MSLDIEYTASCGSTKIKGRITTPMPTTNGDSGEAVTQFVTNTIDVAATTVTNLAMTTAPKPSLLGVSLPVNGSTFEDTRTQVSISHSMDSMLMLDIYDLEGKTRSLFATRNTKVSSLLARIVVEPPRNPVLVNYRGETLDLDATLAECGVEDGEALWMKVKKEQETWSGVVAER